MSDNTLDNGSTDTNTENQAQKTYTQEEFDRHMAGLKASMTKKLSKQFEDLGDLDELRELKRQAETRRTEEAKKRGDFDRLMQELAQKKDAEIQKRDQIIREYRVNTPLIEAASRYNAVNAEQVKRLLNDRVRLNDTGDVEVVDESGKAIYADNGRPLEVDDLVRSFLDSNPHFRSANPASTNTKSSVSAPSPKAVDVSTLDMNNPDDRARYREHRKALGLR